MISMTVGLAKLCDWNAPRKYVLDRRKRKKCKTSNFDAVNFSRTRIKKTVRNSWVSLIGYWSSSDKL